MSDYIKILKQYKGNILENESNSTVRYDLKKKLSKLKSYTVKAVTEDEEAKGILLESGKQYFKFVSEDVGSLDLLKRLNNMDSSSILEYLAVATTCYEKNDEETQPEDIEIKRQSIGTEDKEEKNDEEEEIEEFEYEVGDTFMLDGSVVVIVDITDESIILADEDGEEVKIVRDKWESMDLEAIEVDDSEEDSDDNNE